MVLDHSKRESGRYDVLYIDLNANGDLTEPTERLVGQAAGNDIRFGLPDLTDPATAPSTPISRPGSPESPLPPSC